MTETSNVTFHSDTIHSCTLNDNHVIYSAITKPPIPLPLRLGDNNISIDSNEFSGFLREHVGLGKYRAAYITHDFFLHEGKLSPLTHQLGFLLRVIMNGEVELREEEIIYNSINNIEFLYYHHDGTGETYTHQEMKNAFNVAALHLNPEDTEQPLKYLDYIEEYFQSALDKEFIGIYPREIWRCFDMISVSKVQ